MLTMALRDKPLNGILHWDTERPKGSVVHIDRVRRMGKLRSQIFKVH